MVIPVGVIEKEIDNDLQRYELLGGTVKYPFPIEDFALRVFGLDIQYENFDNVFESNLYNPNEIFGCLFPDGYKFQGIDKIILINTNRAPFYLGCQLIPEEYYKDYAERQTIAHETGHYSKNYSERGIQLKLFEKKVKGDTASSIIIYPKEEETYANRYARLLLMPEKEVITLIARKNILGTIDLVTHAPIFTEYFGVTQFMVEIRLNELEIPFINGVYIKRTSRFRGKAYASEDLLALLDIAERFGTEHGYYDFESIAITYNKLRSQNRASAPLYMVYWRMMRGDYDSKYPDVFERRILLNLRSYQRNENNVTLKVVK